MENNKLSTQIVNEINKEFNLKLKTIDSMDMDSFINELIKRKLINVLDRIRESDQINISIEFDIIKSILDTKIIMKAPHRMEKRKPQTEIQIAKFDTIEKIVKQLKWCNYENEAGCLKNNVAFIALKRMA